jgi:anti-anti-sigma factor
VSDRGIAAILRDDVDGVEVVHVEGEVDLTNAGDVQQAVETTTTPAVVLDLTRVAYLDSSGIRAIDRGHRHLVSEQRSLFIVSPPDTPADWTFRVAGFRTDMLLASLDAALASAAAKARKP